MVPAVYSVAHAKSFIKKKYANGLDNRGRLRAKGVSGALLHNLRRRNPFDAPGCREFTQGGERGGFRDAYMPEAQRRGGKMDSNTR